MNKHVSFEEVLSAKENRQKLRALIWSFMPYTLISFTVNYVGTIKKNPDTLLIFQQGVGKIEKTFYGAISFKQLNYFDTGYEGYFAVDKDAKEVKKIVSSLEDSQILGRLWDIDVFDNQNNQLTRGDIGLKKRKCLVCEECADDCYVVRRHNQQELMLKIKDILKKFRDMPEGNNVYGK